MQVNSPTQPNGIITTQPSLSQPQAPTEAAPIARASDTVSISDAAKALARSEVNESAPAEKMESTATQIKEGELYVSK